MFFFCLLRPCVLTLTSCVLTVEDVKLCLVARSSVWHLLLELQASALELLQCKSQKNLQIEKNSKKNCKSLEKNSKNFTCFLRHRVLSSREFDPESRADVGEPGFLNHHLDGLGLRRIIVDRRSSFCLQDARGALCTGLHPTQDRELRARHAENAESTSGLQVTSFISF